MRIDLAQGVGTISGFGVPTGGTANQVLSKVNSTDFNTQWVDATSEFTSFTASTNITRGYAVRLRDNGTIIATNTISGETFPIIGIAQQSGTTGSTVQVAVEGNISEVHTGLLPGYNYYTDANGLITTTGDTYVGVALSPTQINVSFSNPGGITTPSLNVIDNTITNPDDITTPGRYIVPVSGNTGVFVGEANDYADYDGSSFTFTLPTNGDKASIATGPNAGNVYLFTSGATSGWTLSSQVTTLPTSNWTIGGTYKQNDLVIYQNVLYQANSNIPANTAFVIGTSGLTWKQIGYGNVIPEFGSTIITGVTNIGTTVVDVTTFTLPSAGTYAVTQVIRAEVSSATGIPTTFLTNSSNVVVPDSQVLISFSRTGQSTVSQVSYITTTGPQTFKVRAQCSTSGIMNILSDNVGISKVSWEKISGFLPSTGSISTSRSATLFGAIPGGGPVGTDITGVTFSVGNIPLSNSGVWTLTAGVTYQIECSVTYDAGGTNQFQGDTFIQFVDATTNTPLPNQNGASTITPFFTTKGLTRNGYCIFQYTPSTNQTIKLRVTFQNSAGSVTAQTFINQLGTTNVSQFMGTLSNSWSNGNTYPSGALVVNNGVLYQANNTILAGTGFNIGTTGNTWNIVGGSQNTIPEFGSGTIATINVLNNTTSDLTSFTLPSAGIWEISFSMRVRVSSIATYGTITITDAENNIVPGSNTITNYIVGPATVSDLQNTVSKSIFVTTTGPATYKLRLSAVGGTVSNFSDTGAGTSTFSWNKVSGFLPSTGSISTSRSATLITSLVGGGLIGQDMSFVTNSVGNIPLNGTGVWTLTAGVTYQLMCSVSYDAEATNQFQGDTEVAFVDSTTNTILPNQTNGTLITPFFTGRGLSRRGTIIFQYTPSTNQTVKLRVLFQSNSGTLRAQTFINQLGTTNVSQFLGTLSNSWSNSNTYPSGTLVVNNGMLYQANSTILAGTGFNIGTMGSTWRAIDAVPLGGTTGQVLRKVNNTNYNTEWATPGVPLWEFPGGGPTIGGTTTAPTIGGTIFRNEQFYRQVGPRAWEVSLALDKDAGGNAGSGDYLFSLPVACPDFQNFGIQPFWTLDVASNAARLQRYAIANSYGSIHHNITPSTTVQIIAYDARRYRVLIHDEGAAIRCMGSAWFEMDKSLGLMLQFQYQSV